MKAERQIIYSKEFDQQFRYDGKDLGAACTEEGTIFKVWSPLADRVEIRFYKSDKEDVFESKTLNPDINGTWVLALSGDLHGIYYDYEIYRDGAVIKTADPYAVGCGCNGSRSMVVDLSRTNPDDFENDRAPEKTTENIIYELHIKDFSHDPNSGVPDEYRGKYKAFTIHGTNEKYPTCIDYLKKLGITHVHLLPFYDYGWLDETKDNQYNWGYDPVNYNVPEGSYATNPYDGSVRIRECKEMIQALHRNGIRVVMDVVYNHTYEPDSWLERTVPGYYNRRWQDGSLANGSACGSDIAAGRAMVDNYIADSVMYWAKEYHIDGFRFDLMGLLTVELMNRIRKELDEEFGKDEKLLYGEPWRATDSPMETGTIAALKDNVAFLDEGIAMFSDDTRDIVKGHVFYEEIPGFVNGGNNLEYKVLDAISGWRNGGSSAMPKSCSQIINYVSAHDNFTLWDKLVMSMHGGTGVNNEYRESSKTVTDPKVFTTKYDDVLKANKLAALMYFTFQGHIFLHAGEEYGRTKLGDGNSYRSDPNVNMIRWEQTIEFADLLMYYEGLIRLRKKLPGLYDKSATAHERILERDVNGEKLVSFLLDNNDFEDKNSECQNYQYLLIAYNADDNARKILLPEGNWKILADAEETDCCKIVVTDDKRMYTIQGLSGVILGRMS